MASLNLSIDGPSIKSSYQSVVNGPPPSGSSATAASWALFTVKAPLLNAFQDTGAKESILRVQGTGHGELVDLFEDFSEGHMQFAFVKVKDPNTGLPKQVLIAWCGGGLPERTKGYFTSHLNAASKVLHGYHVQITARSDSDLEPDALMRKVANASGAKYSTPSSTGASKPSAPPSVAAKPVFTPTALSAVRGGFNPLVAARSRKSDADDDGWGADAPPVTRTQLEKVESAYKPTKVNMAELTGQGQEPSRFQPQGPRETPPDVVKGAYQPVGKVDIAAIRAAAKEKVDDRPAPVKGAYEPIGKVDIAAIRAKAQKPREDQSERNSFAEMSAAFSQPEEAERLTSIPKPKVAKKFGGGSFTGTKPPAPGALGYAAPAAVPATAPVGAASRTFADKGGKTPAQLWAEKKAKQGGVSAAPISPPTTMPILAQTSGGGGWKSGYTGKSWSVNAPTYSREAPGGQVDAHASGDSSKDLPSGGVTSIKDRFSEAPPVPSFQQIQERALAHEEPSAPPPLPESTRPVGGVAIPGLPSRPAEPEPEAEQPAPPEPPRPDLYEREESPPRIAVPISHTAEPDPEPAPRAIPPPVIPEPEPEPEPVPQSYHAPEPAAAASGGAAGKKAVIQYDYEKAEDNEIELREGEYVTNIDMVDEDWWMGTNSQGETGLFPSNYVELVDDLGDGAAAAAATPSPAPLAAEPTRAGGAPVPSTPAAAAAGGPTAIAMYDYEAAEDNELSFPENAKITGLEFPDEDWWFGHYNGQSGLFPANYVQRDA